MPEGILKGPEFDFLAEELNLSESDRIVLRLALVAECSPEEIAAAAGMELADVERRISEATARISAHAWPRGHALAHLLQTFRNRRGGADHAPEVELRSALVDVDDLQYGEPLDLTTLNEPRRAWANRLTPPQLAKLARAREGSKKAARKKGKKK